MIYLFLFKLCLGTGLDMYVRVVYVVLTYVVRGLAMGRYSVRGVLLNF
jgi:hypothetical protein